jgi:hypothetical protein
MSADKNVSVQFKANQTISFTAPAGKTYGDPDFSLGVTTTSPLPVSYASTTTSVCTIVSGNLHIVTAGSCSVTASQAGDATNYNAAADVSRTFTIAQKAVTATTLTVSDKVYDGTTAATLTAAVLSGVIAADEANVGVSLPAATAAFTNKNVGNAKTVNVSGLALVGSAAANYALSSTTGTATANITPRGLTITATGVDKGYDGTTAATVTLADDRVAGDLFTDAYTTATFADKNVGTNKTVSVSGIGITGTDAGNYTFNTTASITANITARALTVTATGVNKVYDGTTAATVTLSDNRISGDVFTDSYTGASFANKHVGTGKAVSVTGISISGTDAGNYTANATASATADITARALTITATGVNKVYDGTTAATVTLADNRVSGDTFTDTYSSATFADKNVGIGKAISVSGISIAGDDAGDYTFNTSASATANIAARTLAVSATGVNKVYDGNTSATVTLTDDRVAGDVFTDSYTTATFADKNAAAGKTVTVSGISISGTDAANYSANTSTTTTANITTRALSVAAHGVNKVYDGTTAATVTLSDDRVSGDVFTASYASATFADKNVGAGKAVTVSGISISGTDAGNYSANTSAATTADITQRTLAIMATGVNKVYDGTNAAMVNLSDNRVSGDVFTDSYTSATFADKNAANGKTVSVSGISIAGVDASNYTFNTATTTTANITPLAITGSITANNKVYDGTTAATIATRTLSGHISGDNVSYDGGTATFNDKNVANGKTVTATGLSLGGTDAGNYTVNTTATTTADITPRSLTITAAGVNKMYDNTTAATVNLSDNRVSGDNLTTNYASASFADKNVGTNKPISVAGITIGGVDAGNYTFNATATTTANITALAITGSITANNKVYDGNTMATIATRVLAGVLGTNDVSYVGGTAAFSDKNVGNGKTVMATGLSLSGADAGNYTVNTTATTTADITKRPLIVSATGVNKVYDGTTAATVNLSDNRVSGDNVATSYATAAFADKNVGTGKAVSVTGISITGDDAGNYSFNTTASTTADITQRTLAITATGLNKVYDGTIAATVSLSDNRVSGDVFTDSYTSATFADKNVGTNKPVSVSGISISGTDAGNYTFNASANTTADITARALAVTATGLNKVYDGNATASVTFTDDRVNGDVFAVSGSASFNNKNVGAGKPVSVTGISLSGTDAGNYSPNPTTTTAADITARQLTITATGVNKVYDNSTNATVNLSDNRVLGDALTIGYAAPATFADKNVGNGIAISVTGISVTGDDAGNYTFNTTAATSANITKRGVHVTVDDKQVVWTGSPITPSYTISLDPGTPMAPGETFFATLGTPSFTPATVTNVGVYTPVTVSGLNNTNYAVTVTPGTVTVLDQSAPTGTLLTLNPVGLGATTTLKVNVSDVLSGNSNITKWKYSVDGASSGELAAPGTPSADLSASLGPFSQTDVKKVCFSGMDAAGNWSLEVCGLLAIYDPTAGFVTGGGWINSPSDACRMPGVCIDAQGNSLGITGKANFGFNAKYKKGATVPDGNAEFQFQAGNLNFSSIDFQWLVIQGGSSAQFKGTGTINGSGKYNFMVTAVDGDATNGTKKPDSFRMKITNLDGTVVYDNQLGKDDSGIFTTTLGGGSIVIHDK